MQERWIRHGNNSKRNGKRVPNYRLAMQEILDLGVCPRCGFEAEDPIQLEVHHIVSLKDGGTHDKENLAVLCANCHKLITFGRGSL